MKRLKPVTSCTNCGAPGYNIAVTDYRRCKRPGCKGTIQSAIGIIDWAECPSCSATGREGDKVCGPCEGSGWLFARGR